jgi:hypothetical protein
MKTNRIIIASVIGVIGMSVILAWVYQSADSFSKCKQVLIEAKNNNDLTSALHRANGTGIALRVGDEGLVVIRCQHSFINGVLTRTIAMTSDGRFLKSKACYCDSIREYVIIRSNVDKSKILLQEPTDATIRAKLTNIMNQEQEKLEKSFLYQASIQPDMDSAIAILENAGFEKWK